MLFIIYCNYFITLLSCLLDAPEPSCNLCYKLGTRGNMGLAFCCIIADNIPCLNLSLLLTVTIYRYTFVSFSTKFFQIFRNFRCWLMVNSNNFIAILVKPKLYPMEFDYHYSVVSVFRQIYSFRIAINR